MILWTRKDYVSGGTGLCVVIIIIELSNFVVDVRIHDVKVLLKSLLLGGEVV